MAVQLRNAGGVERELFELGTRQHGVVSRGQLLGLGLSGRTVDRWIARGRLRGVHEGVFATGSLALDRRGWWWAGVLAYGGGALLSHRSAAQAWGLGRQRGRLVEVTAPCGRQGVERRRRLWIHRCKLIHPEEWTEHQGVPVTTVPRTLFDYAEIEPFSRLEQAWEAADRRNLLQLAAVERVCERGRGRRALKPIRRLLAEARAAVEGRSPLEDRFHRFLRDHRIPSGAANVEVLDHEVDMLWPAARLIVELDSWEHHGHRAAFERDRARDPERLIAGYRTIRVTHHRLDEEAAKLATEIRQLLLNPPQTVPSAPASGAGQA